mgnify:CR=1 FL=1
MITIRGRPVARGPLRGMVGTAMFADSGRMGAGVNLDDFIRRRRFFPQPGQHAGGRRLLQEAQRALRLAAPRLVRSDGERVQARHRLPVPECSEHAGRHGLVLVQHGQRFLKCDPALRREQPAQGCDGQCADRRIIRSQPFAELRQGLTFGGSKRSGHPREANLYLNPLDHPMAAAGWPIGRYADDSVILCRREAEAQAALAAVRAWVSEARLTLHPEKTRIVDATQRGGFDFLGYHCERGLKWPRAKNLKKLRERLRQKTPRLGARSLATIVADGNRSLPGGYAYFQHRQANPFATVDGEVRRRLRRMLQKRRGRTRHGLGPAHQRWPNECFARRGLLSLAAAHGWTRTIVSSRTH